jgi:hypothetical protein
MAGMKADVIAAARNNAEWCDTVCRTHGIVGAFHPGFWASARRTPRHHPDAVTLDAAASSEHLLEAIDTTSPGCSVKDSFATLDLSPQGFRILLEAEWIQRAAGQPIPAAGTATRWRRLPQAGALAGWEAAWSGDGVATGLFQPALLEHDPVSVLGGYVEDRLVAGAILKRSQAAVGVSNLFTTAGDLGDAWQGCLAAIGGAYPGLPVVGYESGEALLAAQEQGFTVIGHLRVWIDAER